MCNNNNSNPVHDNLPVYLLLKMFLSALVILLHHTTCSLPSHMPLPLL